MRTPISPCQRPYTMIHLTPIQSASNTSSPPNSPETTVRGRVKNHLLPPPKPPSSRKWLHSHPASINKSQFRGIGPIIARDFFFWHENIHLDVPPPRPFSFGPRPSGSELSWRFKDSVAHATMSLELMRCGGGWGLLREGEADGGKNITGY
jgi:hypothetical protein